MNTLILPATRIIQGDITLYAASAKVKDLMSDNFFKIETLDPEDPNGTGYQRILNEARAKKLAAYILEGQNDRDVLIPTSLFLATDKDIPYNEGNKTIEITSAQLPLNVVDGQHRINGLVRAAEKDKRVLSFEVPVNIAINMSKTIQMCHFFLVNTTQKIVDKSVEQRIIARLTQIQRTENVPSLPRWIADRVKKGEEGRAIRYVEYLNKTEGSPWVGKIQMANQTGSGFLVKQRSFIDAVIKFVLTANNVISDIDMEQGEKIFLNYWIALSQIIGSHEEASVLYKYNGVTLFCQFSTQVFMKMDANGEKFTVDSIKKYLKSCFDNLEYGFETIGTSDYWASGGIASGHNRGGLTPVYSAMVKALHKSNRDKNLL